MKEFLEKKFAVTVLAMLSGTGMALAGKLSPELSTVLITAIAAFNWAASYSERS